jgi:hypothetical protein
MVQTLPVPHAVLLSHDFHVRFVMRGAAPLPK